METTTISWANTSFLLEKNLSIGTNTTITSATDGDLAISKSTGASPGLIYVSYVSLPVLLVAGLCGNAFTLIVTRSKAYTSNFHGLLIAAMAITDLLYAFCFPFSRGFVQKLFGLDVRALSNIGCSAYVACFRTSKLCSAALVVVVCLERFALIWFPHKAKLVLTKRFALITIACVFVGLLAFCGAWSTLADVKGGKCISLSVSPENKHIAKAFSSVGMALHSFIPASMLLVFTPLAIIKLYYQQSSRPASTDKRKNNRQNELFRASVTLLGVVVAYLVLVSPFCVARHIFALQGINISATTMRWARNLDEIAKLCEQTNCVLNFFLYVLLSPSFREHFRSIFTHRLKTGSSITGSTAAA